MTDKEKDHNVIDLKAYKEQIIKKLADDSYGDESYEDYEDDGSNILMIDLTKEEVLYQLNKVFPDGIPEELNCSKFFLMGILEDYEGSSDYIETIEESEYSELEDLEAQCDELLMIIDEKDMIIEQLLQETKLLHKNIRKSEKTIRKLTEDKQDEPK